MGLLDGLLGNVLGGGQAGSVIESVISEHGGVGPLLQQLQQGGLGKTVESWVGSGGNLPVSADQIKQALDSSTLAKLAAQHGISVDSLCQQLATHLPKAVDQLTPDGAVPDADDSAADSSNN